MDDTVSECDTFDTEIDQLQARRQNSDQYDKKKGLLKDRISLLFLTNMTHNTFWKITFTKR